MQNGRGNCVSANCMLHCVPIIRCECCIQRYAAQQENVHQVNFIHIPICHILAQLFFMSYHISYQRSANILRKHRVCPRSVLVPVCWALAAVVHQRGDALLHTWPLLRYISPESLKINQGQAPRRQFKTHHLSCRFRWRLQVVHKLQKATWKN